MANRTYLTYQNKRKEIEQFQYTSIIPSLWIELTDINLIENQEQGLIKIFNETNFEKNDSVDISLKIPKNVAILNLSNKINQNLIENEDEKKLRIEFLKFIQTQVDEDSIIEISLLEIMFLDEEPVIFQELKEIHKNQPNQNKKISFQSIGFNDKFESFSSIYQNLNLEAKAINDIIKQKEKILKKKEKTAKYFDIILMTLIALTLSFLGIFGIIVKDETKLGIILLSLSFTCCLYLYFKYLIK